MSLALPLLSEIRELPVEDAAPTSGGAVPPASLASRFPAGR